jgi:hypothetical protein
MNRRSECEYDDKKQKSRTQKLKEKLLLLEERVRELESDPSSSASNGASSVSYPTPSHTPGSSIPSSDASQEFVVPEMHRLDTSPSMDFDTPASTYSPFDSPGWPTMASSVSPSSSTSLYPPFHLEGPSGSETSILAGPLLNNEDYDSEQSVHNYFEIPPFTGRSGPTFPYMQRWDPKDPLPYENRKIL